MVSNRHSRRTTRVRHIVARSSHAERLRPGAVSPRGKRPRSCAGPSLQCICILDVELGYVQAVVEIHRLTALRDDLGGGAIVAPHFRLAIEDSQAGLSNVHLGYINAIYALLLQ